MELSLPHDRMGAVDIIVDVDGCLYPFHEAIDEYMVAVIGPPPRPWNDEYHLHDHWDMTAEEWIGFYRRGVEAGMIFDAKPPYEGGREALVELSDAGHKIKIVTARDLPGLETLCREQTLQWLNRYDIPHDELHVTSDKHDVWADVIIDDRIKHLLQLQNAHQAVGILFNRGWNVSEVWPLRVSEWHEVPPIIETMGPAS